MKQVSRWLSQEFHGWLAGVISWQERALAILNGPGLQYAALGAAFVMRVPWLQHMPGLDIWYTCLVLLGVDMQYIACWRKAAETKGWGWERILWILVALALSLPVFQTNAVFTLHSQTGMDELAAMGMIWLTSTQWAIECAVYLVILIAVSALSRPKHAAPVVVAPAPAPAPTAPDKPKGRARRDIGRTDRERLALRARIAPQVIALHQQKMGQRKISEAVGVSTVMVRDIINEHKQPRKKGA